MRSSSSSKRTGRGRTSPRPSPPRRARARPSVAAPTWLRAEMPDTMWSHTQPARPLGTSRPTKRSQRALSARCRRPGRGSAGGGASPLRLTHAQSVLLARLRLEDGGGSLDSPPGRGLDLLFNPLLLREVGRAPRHGPAQSSKERREASTRPHHLPGIGASTRPRHLPGISLPSLRHPRLKLFPGKKMYTEPAAPKRKPKPPPLETTGTAGGTGRGTAGRGTKSSGACWRGSPPSVKAR